jgi:hemolysin activation/secretion protein|tara:strand:+ start:5183 stop:6856 length:1674 start_codon:yes stop_codon:yes gene_type:complete
MFAKILIFLLITLTISQFAHSMDDSGILEKTLPFKERKQTGTFRNVPRIDEEIKTKDTGPQVVIDKITIKGNSLIKDEEIFLITNKYLEKSLNLQNLNAIINEIGFYYRKNGYWARAILPEQDIENGQLLIEIYEGILGSVEIEKKDKNIRFSEKRSKAFILYGQKKRTPINILKLENAVKELSNVPGIESSIVLKEGENTSETDVVIKLSNTPMINGLIKFDNQGTRSTGRSRAILSVNLDGLFNIGDRFLFQHLQVRDIKYKAYGLSLPILNDGTKIKYMYTNMNYELGYPFKSLDAEGKSNTKKFSISKPLIFLNNINVRFDYDFLISEYSNESLGATISDKSIKSSVLSSILTNSDSFMGEGTTWGILSFTNGKLDLSGQQSNLNSDSLGAKTNGHFNKIFSTFTRIQRLGRRTTFWLMTDFQFSFKNLDSSQKLSLGGGNGVRAYPVSEANGDNAIIIKSEIHHYLSKGVEGLIFFDYGRVKLYKNTWTPTTNNYSLKGAGIGIISRSFYDATFKTYLARKVGSNKGADTNGNDNDGTDNTFTFWIEAFKNF